ncbi:hypothetical protein BDQ12DRAFT_744617 [Crucibulum laeve]|uniref:Uncharacterized protein n=1 Tax=Crucibulum laeve TaxID=68775 RepID=A0A5C3M388_9AGAR|nr:hypothetical protein BDQ12DRAFT_744617 [Crucibulum laeve]
MTSYPLALVYYSSNDIPQECVDKHTEIRFLQWLALPGVRPRQSTSNRKIRPLTRRAGKVPYKDFIKKTKDMEPRHESAPHEVYTSQTLSLHCRRGAWVEGRGICIDATAKAARVSSDEERMSLNPGVNWSKLRKRGKEHWTIKLRDNEMTKWSKKRRGEKGEDGRRHEWTRTRPTDSDAARMERLEPKKDGIEGEEEDQQENGRRETKEQGPKELFMVNVMFYTRSLEAKIVVLSDSATQLPLERIFNGTAIYHCSPSLGRIHTKLVFCFYHSLLAFVFATGPDAATRSYTDISSWINLVNVDCEIIVGDWVLRQPFASSLAWMSGLRCSVFFLAGTLHVPALVNSEVTFPYNAAFWGLLVWRLWTVDQEVAQYRTNHSSQHENLLRHVMRIILESGMIYTVSALATFITIITKSTSTYPITALAISAVGVAFNLIIIRSARRDSIRNAISSSSGTIPLQFISPRQTQFSVTRTDTTSRIVTAGDTFYESEASLLHILGGRSKELEDWTDES